MSPPKIFGRVLKGREHGIDQAIMPIMLMLMIIGIMLTMSILEISMPILFFIILVISVTHNIYKV